VSDIDTYYYEYHATTTGTNIDEPVSTTALATATTITLPCAPITSTLVPATGAATLYPPGQSLDTFRMWEGPDGRWILENVNDPT
jgi:hypothetical protein